MQVVAERFTSSLERDADKSPAIAAIETLYAVVNMSSASTVIGLTDELKQSIACMRRSDYSNTSVLSASELFMRFISLATLDQPNFDECRKVLLSRGQKFLSRVCASRQKIVTLCTPFIKDGSNILVHAYSRVVCESLMQAAAQGKVFNVYVTESRPDCSGCTLRHKLAEQGITCTVILDAAVAHVMERVNFVMVGAEGVVETGGIINKVGTLNVGLAAQAYNKPMYALAESVKFVKEYPLNQKDVRDSFKYRWSVLDSGKGTQTEHPLVDYTPPNLIQLLFTDLGILTPAAVSDELIKLYM